MTDKVLFADVTIKCGSATAIATLNPVLLKGQLAIEIDTGKMKCGDGIKTWSQLPYINTLPADIATAMFTGTYDTNADGKVDAADTADSAAKLSTKRKINNVDFDGTSDITIYDGTKIPTSEKGAANGVATLGPDGLIPSAQLPSYVDDVVDAHIITEATALSAGWLSLSSGGAALTPEQGKIYVVVTTGAYLNKTYRWSGSTYVEISSSPDIATQAEAETGTNDAKIMTPLKTKKAIDAQRPLASVAPGALVSGETGTVGTSENVAREDHTHTLPAYPTALPPNGAAGGDLTGTYPNPTLGAKKVLTAAINDLAVTEEKLGALSVTTAKIKDGAVTTSKILDGNVTDDKIDTVNVSKIFVGAGDTLVINGGEITP